MDNVDGGGNNKQQANNFEDAEQILLVSMCDDLSFSMYVEETITETVRELETKKGQAVNGKRDGIKKYFMIN